MKKIFNEKAKQNFLFPFYGQDKPRHASQAIKQRCKIET